MPQQPPLTFTPRLTQDTALSANVWGETTLSKIQYGRLKPPLLG